MVGAQDTVSRFRSTGRWDEVSAGVFATGEVGFLTLAHIGEPVDRLLEAIAPGSRRPVYLTTTSFIVRFAPAASTRRK